MLFQTPTQFAILALCLIAGWLFGLASSSGGRKWREKYRVEEAAHRRYREEVAADLKTRDARLRELEVERDRLARPTAATVPAATAATGTVRDDVVRDRVRDDDRGGGWFGWGRDNLSRIRGVDAEGERLLNDRGIKTYRAIEGMTPDDQRALEVDLNLNPGTIEREHWREQAAMLREGRDDDHRGRWG